MNLKNYTQQITTTPKKFVKEVQIDTDFEILFPDDYINSISERLSLYNKLGSLKQKT